MADQEQKSARVASLAKSLSAELAPEFAGISQDLGKFKAEVMEALGGIEARLALLEQMWGNEAKRPPKIGARKAGGAAGRKAPNAGSPADKVRNAMHFTRYARAHEPGLIAAFVTEDVVAAFENESGIAGKEDPTDRAYAEGLHLWKHVLTKAQQDDIRAIYTKWKEDRARGAMEQQLAEE